MDFKHLLKIFIIIFLILSIIIFIFSIGLTLNKVENSKKMLQAVTIEGLDTLLPSNKAFCEVNKGFTLEQSCNNLTRQNCGLTSCCVWTSDQKCKAGNISGPTFNTNSSGKTNKLEHYYFQNKCYGEMC
jgi:hypothetical protein